MALTGIWLLVPQLFLSLWQIGSDGGALIVARRSGALFLGFGLMFWLARDAEKSPTRDALAAGFSISSAALAALGVFEFATGNAGAGIWLAVIVEIALSVGFYGSRC
jgi:threonine/homoserine efflux transporter RhtA